MPAACKRLVALLFALSAAIASVRAEPWPTKPIRVIVPVAPGTGVDTISRLIFHQLSLQLGQQIVVENRGGAGGTIGVAAVAKADPDGYTLLGHSSSHTIAPAIYPSLPYDTARDFAAVAAFGKMPTALVLAPAKGFRTVQELVAAARAKPGSFTYASAGIGSTTHLTAERFRLSAGFEAIHVPYRGGGFRPEVASGRVDFAFSPIAVALSDIREGRLIALAVSSRERASALPDVPTTVEGGYPDSDYTLWAGVLAPAKTPREIIDRLHQETMTALQTPALREKLAGFDVEPMAMSPAEFDAFIRGDILANAALAKAAGLKAN
jgi:tripartite-type tricarboxylate transporter receptor subunit TctC